MICQTEGVAQWWRRVLAASEMPTHPSPLPGTLVHQVKDGGELGHPQPTLTVTSHNEGLILLGIPVHQEDTGPVHPSNHGPQADGGLVSTCESYTSPLRCSRECSSVDSALLEKSHSHIQPPVLPEESLRV